MTTISAMATRRPSAIYALVTAFAASAVASAGWLSSYLAGVDLHVVAPGQPGMTIGIGAVIFTSLAASLTGWATLLVLRRLTPRSGQYGPGWRSARWSSRSCQF